MLGLPAFGSQRTLKGLSNRETSRKVRAVEVPFGGSKHKNSFSALISAIHVKSLLSDLSKLLQGDFNLLSTTLRDLKAGRDSIFDGSILVNILAFLSVASHSARGRKYERGAARSINKCLMGLYYAWFPSIRFPAGRKISNLVDPSAPSENQICVISTLEVKLKSKN